MRVAALLLLAGVAVLIVAPLIGLSRGDAWILLICAGMPWPWVVGLLTGGYGTENPAALAGCVLLNVGLVITGVRWINARQARAEAREASTRADTSLREPT